MSKSNKHKDPHAEREAQKYANPIPSREYILGYLSERGKPATQEQIEDELGLHEEDEVEALRRRLIAMLRDGQLLRNRKGAFGPLDDMEVLAGRVVGHKDGFGFVVPDAGGEDLFLSPRQMRQVFHGDRVLARVSDIDSRGRREGAVLEVIERNTQQLVGRLHIESGVNFVESVNRRVTQNILIPTDALGDAKDGQMVVVGITLQPTGHAQPIGAIAEILGDHMAPGMEINVAIRNHELPYEWPEDVLLEASRYKAQVTEEAIEGREDFRKLPFVTIDGEDAKDFDDAVYCKPREKGGWILYVAIADVSYYVRPGTALDKEAYKRGNSVYFPSRVIPMLPETLSNNLCSLNPNVDRLVMVCEMAIDDSGKVQSYHFSEGVIKSHTRHTYNQVHTMMEKRDRKMREQFKDSVPMLEDLYALYEVLRTAREKRGAIDFDMPETKIVFGRDRKIEKIVPYERFGSHKVIEECMLCANICAAKYLEKHEEGCLYRVHEGPTEEKLEDLRRFLQEMGLKMASHRAPEPADYARILRSVQGRPDVHMIQTVLLRSMRQAIYSPENKGHFGLAFPAYAHFTSPIRRYPDLLVHRGIKHVLAGKPKPQDLETLAKSGEHCSMTERRADDATNEVTDWLKCEFMMDKVGQEFSGIISGVTSFGIFVELAEVYVEGLVHISTLPDDYYQFDAITHTLHGEHTNKQYRLGDPISVQVARVNLDECEIDFVLVGYDLEKSKQGRKKGKGKQSKDKSSHSAKKSDKNGDRKRKRSKRKR